MNPRVGIYNRWLATLGGGEKHSLAIAEHLSKHSQVSVISHKPVSKDLAEERLNLDLSRVEFITIPDCHSKEVSSITSNYDLFINASHLDYFPSNAQYSTTLIYFPAQLGRRIIWGRRLKHILRKWFQLPTLLTDIHAFDASGTTFKWSLDISTNILLPKSNNPYNILMDLRSLDKRVQNISLLLDRKEIQNIELSEYYKLTTTDVRVTTPLHNANHELTITVSDDVPIDGQPKIEVSNIRLSLPRYRLYQKLMERKYKGWGIRLQYFPPGSTQLDYIDSYDSIWANSQFTRKWIKKYWKRDSEVLYPPVSIENYGLRPKRNIILNVGRFFAGQHNKKHGDMISAFRELVDNGLEGWEFHLVGGKTPGNENDKYLDQLFAISERYPIYIHPDASYENLKNLYEESLIYWHAGGYGENEKKYPEKFEHFGITTVEAMAAGCIPVVINKGGQREIVEDGISGYLWNTIPELKTHTLNLINDPAKRDIISINAIKRSKSYGFDQFHKTLDKLLARSGVF